MKQQHIITFSISLLFVLFASMLTAQNDSISNTINDSLKIKQKYGLRVGLDLSKLARTFFDDDYTGFEVNGDYRLTKKVYIAGELGNEKKKTTTDFLDVTTKGSYFKVGLDYNFYINWLDMENMIYGGFRVGASTFSHTLNNYTVYTTNQYWDTQFSSTDSIKYDGLTALWAELVIGFKAEVLNNLFVGINVQFKGLLTEDIPGNPSGTSPSGFENIYIPGFNKTYDSGRFGFGYGYNISYLIPIFKKTK